jgi:hypothetical protein
MLAVSTTTTMGWHRILRYTKSACPCGNFSYKHVYHAVYTVTAGTK